MIKYIICDSLRNLPPTGATKAFVYHSSFAARSYTGYGYTRRKGRQFKLLLQWPKWQDNPDCPAYAHHTTFYVVIHDATRHVKNLSSEAFELAKTGRHRYIIWVGMSQAKNPALVDHRAFHRLVFFLSKRLGAIVFDARDRQAVRADQYAREYSTMIKQPFSLRLTPRDLHRLPSGSRNLD